MNKDWYIYERGGAIFATLDPHFRALTKPAKNTNFRLVPRFWAAFRGRHLYWAYGTPEFYDLGKKWSKEWVKVGKKGKYFKYENEVYRESRKYALSVFSQPLPKDKNELVKAYRKLSELTGKHTLVIALSLDAFDETFPEIFSGALRKSSRSGNAIDPAIIAMLSRPAYLSVVAEYELRLIKLALSPKVSQSEIEKLHQEFYWLPLGWSGTGSKTKIQIQKELGRLKRKSAANLTKEKRTLENYEARVKKDRMALCKKYKISLVKMQPYFNMIDYCALLHDRRKEIQMRYMYLMQEIRFAAAKRSGVDKAWTHWMTQKDVEALILNNKVSLAAARQRAKGQSLLILNGKVKEEYGKTAAARMDEMTRQNLNNVTELRGTPASLGIARGKAVVTSNPVEAIKRVKRGSILVTSMTTPDFVPAMKLAAAIITDEGGITSHAAIISRELGVPCIIGAKTATKAIKDGQMLEIDANKGIITLLAKKK